MANRTEGGHYWSVMGHCERDRIAFGFGEVKTINGGIELPLHELTPREAIAIGHALLDEAERVMRNEERTQ